MSSLHLPPMLWSSDAAWTELSRRPPSLATLVFGVALPAAMLPPAMLSHATDVGSAHYLPALSASAWQFVEFALFAAQVAGFLMIRWLPQPARLWGMPPRHCWRCARQTDGSR